MSLSKKKNLHKRWKDLVQQVSRASTADAFETPAQQKARKERAMVDYDFFVTTYFKHYTKDKLGNLTHCGDFHIETANDVLNDPYLKGVLEWGRGLAKSTHADIFLPLWLMIQAPIRQLNFMLLIGKNFRTAKRLLQDVQVELSHNALFIHDWGEQKKEGSWEEGEFQTLQGVAFVALGMGQPPRGARFGADRPDYIVLDDGDDDKLKKNQSRIREIVEWIFRAVIPTMDIGIQRFLLVNNRICKNGILATILKERPHWYHKKVNALNEQGEPSWPQKYTKTYYAKLRTDIGWKAFETEFQNNPIEDGGVFLSEWVKYMKALPPEKWTEYDAIVIYGDMSYSTSDNSDFTAIKCWARQGQNRICLKAYVRQKETPAKAIRWLFNFYYSLPVPVQKKVKCWVEANATQKELLKPIIEAEAERLTAQQFIRYDKEKKGDKDDRIGSMSVHYENGSVFYSAQEEEDPDMILGIEHLTAWEEGAWPDDSPDADESAWQKLFKKGRGGTRSARSGRYSLSNSRAF
ncbi:hypothetical protein [Rufibacter quisquiliarum]|uniref:Putative phage terminase large subunit-like protein n=1 Tax=Rufibacter quisquiliarum TaxID=1549639 RepID=A0A839GJB4_9BACT|nr:hypothetical protein [Rufibacter quisquiliarum]MBA9078952.1 putative phage terminase large subunit-like protein [Rufibacter quisquiliarum]